MFANTWPVLVLPKWPFWVLLLRQFPEAHTQRGYFVTFPVSVQGGHCSQIPPSWLLSDSPRVLTISEVNEKQISLTQKHLKGLILCEVRFVGSWAPHIPALNRQWMLHLYNYSIYILSNMYTIYTIKYIYYQSTYIIYTIYQIYISIYTIKYILSKYI